jgi:hypothetical protein
MKCFSTSTGLIYVIGLHTAFSPCQCIIAVRKDEGSIELKNVEYTQGPLTELKEDGSKLHLDPFQLFATYYFIVNFGAVTSLLALQFSSSAMQHRNTDDLVSVLLKDTSQGLPFLCFIKTYVVTHTLQIFGIALLLRRVVPLVFISASSPRRNRNDI